MPSLDPQLPPWIAADVEKDLFLYLGAGQLSIANQIAGKGGLQVRNWADLLQLAFFLSPDVVRFLRTAATEIRAILPVAEQRQMISNDARRGSVVWPATLVSRARRGLAGRPHFVLNQTQRSLARVENHVLKGMCEHLWRIATKWVARGWSSTPETTGWRAVALNQQLLLQQVRGSCVVPVDTLGDGTSCGPF